MRGILSFASISSSRAFSWRTTSSSIPSVPERNTVFSENIMHNSAMRLQAWTGRSAHRRLFSPWPEAYRGAPSSLTAS